MRKISQTIGALAILGILSTTVASADVLTAAATTPGTTASSTSTVAPDADTASTSGATDVAQAGPLSDVPLNSWAYDAVNQLAKDGIIKGYPDGTFKGQRPMTRYEAAVLAYRAVDMIEAQITAGKTVEKADIDAANKMLAAFGAELKAVERHVAALQQQADTTDKNLATTTALGKRTAAFARRGQIHVEEVFRAGALGQNINANAGPLPIVAKGSVYAPGSALPYGIGSAPTGTSVTGPTTTAGGVVTPGGGTSGGLAWGPQPGAVPQNSNTIGQYNHGIGTNYLGLIFSGNLTDNSEYFVRFTQQDRFSNTNYYPANSPAACTAATIGVAGAACNGGNVGVSNANGIFTSNFATLQQMWYQFTTPGGIYAKIGKFQMDEGPGAFIYSNWTLSDFVNGVHLGYRNGKLNVGVGYGFQDTAAENALITGIPASSIVTWAQADYQLNKHISIGGHLINYSGNKSTIWDASAVNCVNPVAKTSKVIPLVAGDAFNPATGCGAGYAPIVYGAPGTSAGLPVTGSYINAASNQTALGGRIIVNAGQLRLALDGQDRLGNDPTTGSAWLGNLTGFFQADYGAPIKGHYTAELGGFGAGMNSITPNVSYAPGPAVWTMMSTDWADQYFLWAGVKKWLEPNTSVGVYYGHGGLLPNTVIQAGSASCPGCAITGDSRNMVYGEVFMNF